jgi:hypothetical protein
MDARTPTIKSNLSSLRRHAPARGSTLAAPAVDVAPHRPVVGDRRRLKSHAHGGAEVFKKTRCVADLKLAGRDVAKDIVEIAVTLLMKTFRDHGYLHGDCSTVCGRTKAAKPKTVKRNPHQDVVRSADPTIAGGVVGPNGSFASEGAVVKVAGMSNLKSGGPAPCFGSKTTAFELVVAALAARRTKSKPRATDHVTGTLWKYAQQVGPAVGDAVTHPGGAHEKHCYADI